MASAFVVMKIGEIVLSMKYLRDAGEIVVVVVIIIMPVGC